MFRIAALVACVILVGCARSPGAIKVGDDTYTRSMVGNFFTFSGASVEARIVREGAEFCRSRGKRFSLIDSSYQNSGPAVYASAIASFRCE